MHTWFAFPRVGPRILPCLVVPVSTFPFSVQHLLLRRIHSFTEPFVLSLSLHHVTVLLMALSSAMSALSAVETLPLKAFASAFQSTKIGLNITKCLSWLFSFVVVSEARIHGFDTVWINLWALLDVTQPQPNLVDDVLLYVNCNERCATSSEDLQKDQ